MPEATVSSPTRAVASAAPMRVVHSYPVWLPQTQTWLDGQVRHSPPGRVESHVVCERVENLDQFRVPRLHVLAEQSRLERFVDRALRRAGLRRHLGFLTRTARRVRAQVIHSHFGPVGWADAPAVRASGARHVVTFYGMDVNKLPKSDPRWRDRYAELFESVDRVLCEGPHMADCIVDLGCDARKVRVQRLGVDVGSIRYAPRVWNAGAVLRILVVASFREKKGIPDALAAVAALKERAPVELTVIGDAGAEPASQAEKRRIMSRVVDLGLEPVTRFLGYRTPREVYEEADSHHVFLSPSRTAADGDTEGGAPVTITEMAAAGMIVVSTTHCDIPSVVEDGRTGLLAAEGDVDGLAARLSWLVAHPEAWRAMTDAGRAKIEREFDVVRQADALATQYAEVLAR